MLGKPNAGHAAFMGDLKKSLKANEHLGAEDLLAITAQFLGALIACQDQARFTPETIMEMVTCNIRMGNMLAASMLVDTKGNA